MFVSYMYMHERSHKASNQQIMNNSSIVSLSVLYKRLWNISERISELCQNTHIQTIHFIHSFIHSFTLNQSITINKQNQSQYTNQTKDKDKTNNYLYQA